MRKLATLLVFLQFFAVSSLQILRDAEVETILTDMVQKIFKVAGLRPDSAKVFVVISNDFNAFTIGNGYVFVNSGLILAYPNPLHLIAILCHETGHLAAGHITRKIAAMQNSQRNFGLAALASILGAVFGGSEAALALLLGSSAAEMGLYLRFSRDEEMAADALAADYLQKLGYGADVLVDAFEVFRRMDILSGFNRIPAYVSTHPKTDYRIAALQPKRMNIRYNPDDKLRENYDRVLAKIRSLLQKQNNYSIPKSDYEKALLLRRNGDIKGAISLIERIVEQNKHDIFYKELLAQLFHDSGRINDAINIYKDIYLNHDLIGIEYAGILIETNQQLDTAIRILENMMDNQLITGEIFRLLAKAYGQKNRRGMASYMLAREQLLLQNYPLAREFISESLRLLDAKRESAARKKAEDLERVIKRLEQ